MNDSLSVWLVNTANNEKHQLNESEYVIGRGWLECNDKRISRNHGTLRILQQNTVELISTHQNSMFYRKKDDPTVIQIQKDDQVHLNVGDTFGLLVDEHWFRIVSPIAQSDEIASHCENGITHANGDNAHSTNGIKRRQSTDSQPDSTNKKVKTEPIEFQIANVETVAGPSLTHQDQDMNVTQTVNQIAQSNEVTAEIPTTSQFAQNNPLNRTTSAAQESYYHDDHRPIKMEPSENDAQSMPPIQSIKQEPVDEVASFDTNPSEVVVKTEVKQEQQNDEASTSSGTTSNIPARRECCRYGIRCYRRNPLHRTQEAHPGDSDYRLPDYGEPPLGAAPCPFLDRCYRRNPVHFQQFSHKTSLDKKGKDGYEDTAKAPTRTATAPNYAQNNNGNNYDEDDDDEEEDPYGSNSEDDPDFVANDTPPESEDTGVFDADTDNDDENDQ